MNDAMAKESVRLYGNWRRPQSRGLKGLGTIGTLVGLAGFMVTSITMILRGPVVGFLVAAVVGVGLLLMVAKDRHGKSAVARITERVGWAAARVNGTHLYRSGPLARVGHGHHQLPGVLAATELSEFTDAYGRPFGLLTLAKGRQAVVIGTTPDGAALVDASQIDQWVASYGGWLAGLADEPGLVAAAVTVESAPDSGSQLRKRVAARIDPDAPSFAKEVLQQVVEAYPAGSQSVKAWVALTFDAEGQELDAFGRELATRLPYLSTGLSACGAGAARPCSADDLCRVVRVAFDPESAIALDEALTADQEPALSWQDVGPVAHQTGWDSYRHDSGLSMTWEMTDAPRGSVHAQVLSRLLAPHRDIARKRVTVLYRPIDAGRAASAVEQDLDAAEFIAQSEHRSSARQQLAVARAHKTAAEEASGAGLVDFGMLITATVPAHTELDRARAAVDSLKATARLQIRPVYGAQDAAFAASLPLGIVLADLLALPSDVRAKL